MISMFVEREDRFSDFIRFSKSDSEPAAAVTKPEVPALSFLRVECKRVHPGMSDFVIRISSPEYPGVKSNTVLSIRGGKQMGKYDTIEKLAKTVAAEMQKRGDQTFKWEQLKTEHLANMLLMPLKFFSQAITVSTLQFSTEALTK